VIGKVKHHFAPVREEVALTLVSTTTRPFLVR